MTEELRLISMGFPADEAICMCFAMRKEGTLRDFVREEEKRFKEKYHLKKGEFARVRPV